MRARRGGLSWRTGHDYLGNLFPTMGAVHYLGAGCLDIGAVERQGDRRVKLIYLEWHDSSSLGGSVWHHGDDVKRCSLTKCYSIGWILAENDKLITLVSSIAETGGEPDYSRDITIPKACVTKRRRLKL